MANTFITPQTVARLAYGNLYQNSVMAQLVHRDYEADFAGTQGASVTIRKPTVLQVKEFTNATEVQNISESSTSVTLDHHLDITVGVTAKQLTLELADFNQQVVVPAMEGIRKGIDDLILGLRPLITQEVGTATGEEWDDPMALIAAGRVLDQANVPANERYVAAGPITAAEWLKDPLFHQADQRGDTVGLQEASIGRKLGFDIYKTQGIKVPTAGAGVSTTEESIAFHRSALALVTRAPVLPMGAAAGQAAVFGDRGIGIRVVYDYAASSKTDSISFDLLCGVKVLDANRACLIKGADGT